MIRHLGFIGFEIDEYAGSEGGVGFAWLRAAVPSCERITVFTRGDLSSAALDSILALPNVSIFLIPPPFFINKKQKPAILEVGVFRLALSADCITERVNNEREDKPSRLVRIRGNSYYEGGGGAMC